MIMDVRIESKYALFAGLHFANKAYLLSRIFHPQSTDAAHSLSDLVGVQLGGDPVSIAPRLWG